MRATRFRFSPGADGDPLLVLLSEDEGSSVCSRVAPELLAALGEALLAEHGRLAKAEGRDGDDPWLTS